MSPRQFAALTGKAYNTVIEWCATGQLTAIKEGNKWEISYEEYQRYLSGGLNQVDRAEVRQQHENARLHRAEMKRLGITGAVFRSGPRAGQIIPSEDKDK